MSLTANGAMQQSIESLQKDNGAQRQTRRLHSEGQLLVAALGGELRTLASLVPFHLPLCAEWCCAEATLHCPRGERVADGDVGEDVAAGDWSGCPVVPSWPA